MNDRRVAVTIDRVRCRDTESVHSADKFLLLGAVKVDGEFHPFVMPIVRINDWESRTYPAELACVFSGATDSTEIELGLAAWDVDANDSYLENRDDVLAAAKRIKDELQGTGYGDAAAWVYGFIDVATSVIDQFVAWDHDDPLLRYIDARTLALVPYQQHFDRETVTFTRRQDPDYSGYDYDLEYTVVSEWQPSILGDGVPETTMRPLTATTNALWVGDWVGTDVSATIEQEPRGIRIGDRRLDVTVTETYGSGDHTSRTAGIEIVRPPSRQGDDTVARLGVDASAAGAVLGRRDRRIGGAPGQDSDGDRLVLSNGATLEMHALHSPAVNGGERFAEVLVHRTNSEIGRVVGRPGYDVLHRRTNL